MLQQLRSLQGVGYHLPTSLPPLLETLDWNAIKSRLSGSDGEDCADSMKTSAEAVCALGSLRRLTVQHCLTEPLPPSFVTQLPSSVQVLPDGACWLYATCEISIMVSTVVPAAMVQID